MGGGSEIVLENRDAFLEGIEPLFSSEFITSLDDLSYTELLSEVVDLNFKVKL